MAEVTATNPEGSRTVFQVEFSSFSVDSDSEPDEGSSTFYGGTIGVGRLTHALKNVLDIGWTLNAFLYASSDAGTFGGARVSFMGRIPWSRSVGLFENSEVLTPFFAAGADLVFGDGPNARGSSVVNVAGSGEAGIEFFSQGDSTRVALPISIGVGIGLRGLRAVPVTGGLRIDW